MQFIHRESFKTYIILFVFWCFQSNLLYLHFVCNFSDKFWFCLSFFVTDLTGVQ